MAEAFSFYVAQSSNLAILYKINKYSGVNLSLKLNTPGTLSMTIDGQDQSYLQNAIVPVSRCILVYRNGALVWSGPIWTVDETHDTVGKVAITAVGWAELLNHRILRTLPGYGLTTSAITFTNGTFESALSGWSGINDTTARDTVVFRSGAGSWRMAENIATPGPNPAAALIQASANAFSATPTAGKKYRVNFYARARKDAKLMNATPPYLEVLESGVRVGYIDLNNLFNAGSRASSAGAGYSSTPTFVSETCWTTNAAFNLNAIEWVSSGIAPTFRFSWAANTPVMAGYTPGTGFTAGDSSSTGSWGANINIVGADTVHTDASLHRLYFRTPQPSGHIEAHFADWGGEFDTSKTYTCYLSFSGMGYTENGSGELAIYNGGTSGPVTRLGGTGVGSWGGLTTGAASFTFTPSGAMPLWLVFTGTWAGAGSGVDVFQVFDLTFYENGTNVDNLLNVDDVTVQEYVGDGIYQNLDAGQIAINLLNKANADGATKVNSGSVEVTQPRTRTYQRFSNIGKEIKALSDIESGYDYFVDPITRNMNIYNRTNATNFPVTSTPGNAGANSWIYSADRTAYLHLDYQTGKSNLASWRKTQDGSAMTNRLNVQGKYALGLAQDATSQSTYGIFEDLVSLPDVIDATNTVLPAYANAEIAIRKNPKTLYDVQLQVASPNTPLLFIDFNVGDKALLDVQGLTGNFISNQTASITVRIFGVSLTIDSQGNEALSGLQLAA